jgi:hypothetical protein
MEERGSSGRWWVIGSAVLMIVGAFGPWVHALGISVAGTDGSNDGWIVIVAAAVGGLCFYKIRSERTGAVWAIIAGIVGIAVTLYDRTNMQHAIKKGGAFAQALVQVGWGLNLALVASVSLAVAGVVVFRRAAGDTSASPLPPPVSPPPSSVPPTPPPD